MHSAHGQDTACRFPYRTFDGKAVIDLTTLFFYQTNHPYVAISRNPMPDWLLIVGRVASIPREGENHEGILIQVQDDPSVTGNSRQNIIHLVNYPHDPKTLIDGTRIAAFAKSNGRYQYHAVRGGISTVLSYDHGLVATAEQIAIIEGHKRSNYVAQVEAAQLARSNRLARQKMSSQNLSNYTITPRRP